LSDHPPFDNNGHQPFDPDDPPRDLDPPRSDRDYPPSLLNQRIVAVLEVLICSDYPTQIALGGTLYAFGFRPFAARDALSVSYVVAISLADTVLLVGLILLFLVVHGERPRDVFIGPRSVAGEAAYGLPLILAAIGIAIAVLLPIRSAAPYLHTVEPNPMQSLLRSPRDAWLFAVVVVVAGGVREELQRAFLLHRFEQYLGGGRVGVLLTSVAFGAAHWVVQGVDAAIATGVLGAFWGVVYLRRRSAVAPIVSHSGFDLIQIVQFLMVR